MTAIEVIDDPAAAAVALEPVRSLLLSELSQPASAATLATRLGIPRQKVNYHLRTLESHQLVRVAETRQWGGLTERLMVASATSYLVAPGAMGPVAADPDRNPHCNPDRLSASYLIALAARIVREVKSLLIQAAETGKRLPTLSADTVIRFRSAEERAAFTQEFTQAITQLAAKYHDEHAPGGRYHRLVAVAYPLTPPPNQPVKEPS
jgi:DNA-binding transcriptional ArsR family regulator